MYMIRIAALLLIIFSEGINSILNNPDAEKSVKDYIRKSFGKVAERNGGVNGFYGTLDLRLAKKFKTYKSRIWKCLLIFSMWPIC